MSKAMTVCTYGGPIVAHLRYCRDTLQERQVLLRHHLPRLRAGRVAGIVIPVDGFDELTILLAELDESEGRFRLVGSPSEARAAMADEVIAVMLGVSFQAIGANPDVLHVYQRLGMALAPLALNPRNLITDGCGERNASGLSYYGIDVVRRLARMGALIDVSHTSDAGLADVAATVAGPFVASHSNARALCDNPRNLTDDQARTIARHGGLIGLSTYPTLISAGATPTLAEFLDHLDHFVRLVGVEFVALGADFIDFMRDIYLAKIRLTDPTGAMYRGAEAIATQDLASIADLRHIPEELGRRGYSDHDRDLLLGGNVLRVWEDVRRDAGLPV